MALAAVGADAGAGLHRNGGPGLVFNSGLGQEDEDATGNASTGSARGKDAVEDRLGDEGWNVGDGEQSSTRRSERERGKMKVI